MVMDGLQRRGGEEEKGLIIFVVSFVIYLNAGRVKHNTNGGTNRLRGEGTRELGLHNTVSSVSPAHLSPVDAELGTGLGALGSLGNVSNLLSEVEVDGLLAVDATNLDEGGVVVLVPEATFEAKVDAFDVKTGRFGGVLGHFVYI